MLDCGVITRSVTVRLHPDVITCIQIDGGDAAIGRLEERQTTWPGDEVARSVFVPEVRAARIARNQVGSKCSGDGWHIQHSCFRV